jgi:hypothetical protein
VNAEEAWRDALAVWQAGIELSRPMRWVPAADRPDEPLAYIDMHDRQVVVNHGYLERIGASSSLPAVLAHEIGHHIRFPHTLGFAAALEILQRRLIPWYRPSLTNLFFDLQVNEVVGRTMADQLCRVYAGFAREAGTVDPLFATYLAVYEELWALDAGALLGRAVPRDMESRFPAWRSSARLFAQTFWALPDPVLQFVYFCSVFQRYLADDADRAPAGPMGQDATLPDVDDYAGALRGNPLVEKAIERAIAEGWIEPSGAAAIDPMTAVDQITGGRPGSERVKFRRALTGRIYRQLVEEHLIEIPPEPGGKEPDPYIPSTTEAWTWGEAANRIDWTASVLASGALAAAMPLQRTLLPGEPDETVRGVPSVEIYLDTSGSMPDPQRAINAMTLAAQILATATIRQGGLVRAIVYSSGPPLVSDWMRNEDVARDFLLHDSGGGTDYPFGFLAASVAEKPDAVRVVVSDSDFLYNYQYADGALDRVLPGCRRFVALLALPGGPGPAEDTLKGPLERPEFRLVLVRSLADFGAAAAALARGLFA